MLENAAPNACFLSIFSLFFAHSQFSKCLFSSAAIDDDIICLRQQNSCSNSAMYDYVVCMAIPSLSKPIPNKF